MSPKELARKVISYMKPELARKALAAGRWYLGGFYVAPDFSCCCPFGAAVILNPRKGCGDLFMDTDTEVINAGRMAGIYIDGDLFHKRFALGLPELSQDDVRAALTEAAAR